MTTFVMLSSSLALYRQWRKAETLDEKRKWRRAFGFSLLPLTGIVSWNLWLFVILPFWIFFKTW
ncbi:hypothetical protein ACFYKX_11615 [Cytobacillus sp. FJAT-54145]|uniref:Uncharacterized protein n=1 Tax=Cytobacillus spartinae TaxID=3299023 RepID=A0ABW6KBY4_9BACI